MPLNYKTKGTSTFKQCRPGSHIAVCDMIVDLGVQPGFGAFPDPKPQLYMRFEIPAIRVDYEKDGKQLSGPQVIGITLTASMHKKANLRKQLEGWRGRAFSEAEAEAFDVSKVLGQSCMLNVVEKETSNGDIRSNIGAISGLPAGVAKVKAENPLVLYDGSDLEQAKTLPEWLQKKLSEQVKPEYSHATGSYAQPDDSGAYFTQEQPPVDAYDDPWGDGSGITTEDVDSLPF